MPTWLPIAGFGAAGVLARHAVQRAIPRGSGFPWGTFIVNVSGAFIIGLLFTVIVRRFNVAMWLQEATLVGFLGGYTTFSAFALETFLLIERGRWGVAAAYSTGSVIGGVVALFVGIRIGRLA